ncbi:helix-turn-helix domain-containing protein [Paenibacillus abyssi]|uniref:DNA-binding response regulator n=1 Tax=Paenibacillus abyssi TaxID=1340531 RepID=A0A917FUV5_9BACL|nr:helix-turn-helix domain-containing protein [Paenibacillus abyssi]GGG03419.1 hypothetical protein GCM10010916_20660 [Paenibacillus abyssi]
MKVVLVDDERLAIEHIKHLIPWDKHGFEIAATATNGRSALRLCEEHRPQIMIVDIRMPVMDGLELIRCVSDKQYGVKFIVMSAYEDFDYARQAISLGSVSSYLIKHEVDSHKLLHELNKARQAWETEEIQRRQQRSELIKDAVIGRAALCQASGMKPPYAMMFIHADSPFSAVPAGSIQPAAALSARWTAEETKRFSAHEAWQLIGEFPVTGSQFALLFSQKNKAAALMREALHELAAAVQSHLNRKYERSFSVFYACQTADSTCLTSTFHQLSAAALHAVFCGRGALLDADSLPLPGDNAVHQSRSIQPDRLHEGLAQNSCERTQHAVNDLFAQVCRPVWDLRGLYDLVSLLASTVNDIRVKKGMPDIDPFDPAEYSPVYRIDEIARRFAAMLGDLCGDAGQHHISSKLSAALRYIHEQFHNDINIEDVSYATGISPSYLHQLFKRELRRTFLDYLTAHRINQAKRILRQENIKMTEVAARVGYRSPQHFSQVFKRMTGELPHQYRDGGGGYRP